MRAPYVKRRQNEESMNIKFSGKWAIDPETFGVSFQATVDGVNIRCQVDTEALQDIDPSNSMGEPAQQFEANQFSFQEIAESLILSGQVKDGQLFITKENVVA